MGFFKKLKKIASFNFTDPLMQLTARAPDLTKKDLPSFNLKKNLTSAPFGLRKEFENKTFKSAFDPLGIVQNEQEDQPFVDQAALEDSRRKEELRKRQERRGGGRAGTILTGPQGVIGESGSVKRTILGA